MKQPVIQNDNANLPPLLVLSTFLKEKKRTFVLEKLKEFGLVRKEWFDKSLGHQKKDFPYKPFLGRRYRWSTAPVTDAEVDQLFSMIQTLMQTVPQKNKVESNSKGQVLSKGTNKKKRISFLALFLITLALTILGGGGFAAFQIFTYGPSESFQFELAGVILGGTLTMGVILLALGKILQQVKAKLN